MADALREKAEADDEEADDQREETAEELDATVTHLEEMLAEHESAKSNMLALGMETIRQREPYAKVAVLQ